MKVVTQNVLLSRGEVIPSSRLELLDVLLGHIDEERQISRIAPQANLSQLEEYKLVLFLEFLCSEVGPVLLTLRESLRELKDRLGRSRKGVTLLAEEDVCGEYKVSHNPAGSGKGRLEWTV